MNFKVGLLEGLAGNLLQAFLLLSSEEFSFRIYFKGTQVDCIRECVLS